MPLKPTQTSDCWYNNLIAAKADLLRYTPAVLPTACLLGHSHMLFQGLQSMYTPLWHISMISQKVAEGQRSGLWWICKDKICIVHSEVEVRLFCGISFQGTLHRPFQEDLIKKYPFLNISYHFILN